MKKIFTTFLFIIVCFTFCKAQYINIPDSYFVSWLSSNGYSSCLAGNQLDTTKALVKNTKVLKMKSTAAEFIRDLTGMAGFKNLDTLDCSYSGISQLPVLPNKLRYLNCSVTMLSSISGLPNSLTYLDCDQIQVNSISHGLTNIDVLPTSLVQLMCYGNSTLTSLPAFPAGLQVINCGGNQMTTMPALPSSLTTLYCNNNYLTSLPALSSSLNILVCFGNQLTSLPALPTGLTMLQCYQNQLTQLPALPASLTYLLCSQNLLTSLPALPASLVTLICYSDSITSLPTLPASLQSLECSNNKLTSLPALPPRLKSLYCSFNQLTSLPALGDSLTILTCDNNLLTSLPVLPKIIVELICNNNQLTEIPALPPIMDKLIVSNNPGVHCLPPIQEMSDDYFGEFDISGTGITCLPNYIKHPAYTYYYVLDTMPICSYINVNNCQPGWNVKGVTYHETDNDCNTVEPNPMNNIKIKLLDSLNNVVEEEVSFQSGYSFATSMPKYKVQVDTTGTPFYSACPASNYYSLTSATVHDSVNFGLQCKPAQDLGIKYITTGLYGEFFPGFNNSTYINAGDMAKSYLASCVSGVGGTVVATINGPVTVLSASSGGVISSVINGNTITWTVSDFSQVNYYTYFSFVTHTDTSATINDTVCITATITSGGPDSDPSNNTMTQCARVRLSYDPNEKEVNPVGDVAYPFNDWLTYTVHFQNTGTAAARNVRVLDTLDSHLSYESFELLSSSASPMVQIKGNAITFNFANINLPDSNTSKDGSQGYVQYRVKPLFNLPAGTVIHNTASIYFDYNAPVVTNTTTNTINLATGIKAVRQTNMYVYPNPVNDVLNITVPGISGSCKVNVTDVLGRVVLRETVATGNEPVIKLNMSGLASGVYSVSVSTVTGISSAKIIKE